MIRSLIVIFFAVGFGSYLAQNNTLVAKSFVKKDTLIIRWAPTSPTLLMDGLKYGYTLERLELGTSNSTSYTLEKYDFTSQRIDPQSKIIIESYLARSGGDEGQEFSFALILLSSGYNSNLAKAANLIYYDTNFISGKRYQYKITLNNKSKTSILLEVNSGEPSRNSAIPQVEATVKSRNKEVLLKWNAKILQSECSAYHILRSEDSIIYSKITQLPLIHFTSSDEGDDPNLEFIDDSLENGKTYYYKVQGVNHFGEKGATSLPTRVYLKKVLTGIVKIDTIYAKSFERTIKGELYTENKLTSSDLNRFILLSSSDPERDFKVVAEQKSENGSFNFEHTSSIESGDRTYFKVAAISEDGDTLVSFTKYFFTLDQIPPTVPAGLEGIVTEKGEVRLKWIANPENDIKGYRVFRSNSLKEEFVEITKNLALEPSFKDTLLLNTLTQDVYYKIAAVDYNYNNSPLTDAIKLLKPDKIPPVSCLLVSYESLKTGLKLTWINSTSEDVKYNTLMRGYNYNVQKLIRWESDSLTEYIDTSATLGQTNEYRFVTYDLSGNITTSEHYLIDYETGTRKDSIALDHVVNRKEKEIKLEWELPIEKVNKVAIYRAKGTDPMKLHRTLDGASKELYDKELYINNTYRYQIRFIFESGLKSDFSREIVIEY